MKYLVLLLTGILVIGQSMASDKLNVFACEAEWAALSHAIGGDTLKIYTATTAYQDAHRVQARPSLIAKARKADVLICSGAELEIGWLPLLLKKSGNAKIQQNASGYFMATDHVELMGKVDKADRSMGDIHMQGNPHIHFAPSLMAKVAVAFSEKLSTLAPEYTELFTKNTQAFVAQLEEAELSWQPLKEKLSGKKLVSYHKDWVYFTHWLNIEELATLEPKPGITPSTKHLSTLKVLMAETPADFIIYNTFQNIKPAQWLSKRTGIPIVKLPYSPEDWKAPNALVDWYSQLLTITAEAIGN